MALLAEAGNLISFAVAADADSHQLLIGSAVAGELKHDVGL